MSPSASRSPAGHTNTAGDTATVTGPQPLETDPSPEPGSVGEAVQGARADAVSATASEPVRVGGLDATLAFRADPYRWIARQCKAHGSDVVSARLLFKPTLCMTGPAAAALFYDPQRFQREGAAPEPLRATLFGKGGVQGLDGDAHRHRKALFMQLVTPERVADLAERSAHTWLQLAGSGSVRAPVRLDRLSQTLLTRVVCDWAGVPLPEAELPLRTQQLTSLFDDAGGWHHLRARRARRHAEQWLAGLIVQERTGRIEASRGSPLHTVSNHRDLQRHLLEPRVAAVELLNLLRPTVAVSVFITLAAHALHTHPESRLALSGGDARQVRCFVHEVRRFYPFFPAVAARVKQSFAWRGQHFPAGRRALLDLYGSNHDERVWQSPEVFQPSRFADRTPGPFDFMPQGGAEPYGNHRCPGESITVALMQVAVVCLVDRLRYEVPTQDLRIDFQRLPALPLDGFLIDGLRLAT